MEYIIDCIAENRHILKYSDDWGSDFTLFLRILQDKYPKVEKVPYIIHGHRRFNPNMLYNCLSYLLSIGCNKLAEIYPARSSNIKHGWVYEAFSPTTAFEKLKRVYSTAAYLYVNYVRFAFPNLSGDLSLCRGFDLMVINLDHKDEPTPTATIYYFKCLSVNYTNNEILYSLNMNAEIFSMNGITSHYEVMKQTLNYNGYEFEFMKCEPVDLHTVLYNKFNITCTLHAILKNRFDNYFKRKLSLV
jgi:hypothetical protein